MCGEDEESPGKHRIAGHWGEKITRKASKTVVGRCKGMHKAELEWNLEGARRPYGLEKAGWIVYRIQEEKNDTHQRM